jgi:hypothetical protein
MPHGHRKQAFATEETKPLAVFGSDHRQLLPAREDLQAEDAIQLPEFALRRMLAPQVKWVV